MDALHRRKITLQHVIGWARSAQNGSPHYAAWRYEAVRKFLTVAACTRPDTAVPPPGYLGKSFGRRRPHVYSASEIADLLAATRQLTPVDGLRPWTYRTLFGLLYATGLRVGEALALERDDVDRQMGLLVVRRDKSRSARQIPLHPSVSTALAEYGARRDARHPRPRSSAFFLTESRATRLQYQYVNRAFCHLRRTFYWCQSPLPTIHDLRHSFAVRTFLRWIRSGRDVDVEIPILSAYMGHQKPSSTYWYLSAVPELFDLVVGHTRRFLALQGVEKEA
jgi:integrase/recombinase XerD